MTTASDGALERGFYSHKVLLIWRGNQCNHPRKSSRHRQNHSCKLVSQGPTRYQVAMLRLR